MKKLGLKDLLNSDYQLSALKECFADFFSTHRNEEFKKFSHADYYLPVLKAMDLYAEDSIIRAMGYMKKYLQDTGKIPFDDTRLSFDSLSYVNRCVKCKHRSLILYVKPGKTVKIYCNRCRKKHLVSKYVIDKVKKIKPADIEDDSN